MWEIQGSSSAGTGAPATWGRFQVDKICDIPYHLCCNAKEWGRGGLPPAQTMLSGVVLWNMCCFRR